MKKTSLFTLASAAALLYIHASANEHENELGSLFDARGKETSRITIGGHIKTGYQWIDVNDKLPDNCDPQEYSNFLMHNIRLFVNAEIRNGWSALMSIDFAGKPGNYEEKFVLEGIEENESTGINRVEGDYPCSKFLYRSCECKDQCKVYVDRAYIQKLWCDATLRFGYQKVSWGAEENVSDRQLKTIKRSVATNFFTNLGRRVVAGTAEVGVPDSSSYQFAGERFGGRHTGIFVAGEYCNFHWGLEVVNGYQGICMNSTRCNNSLGVYANLMYEFELCNTDMLLGINGGYQPKGGNMSHERDNNVWGYNPFVYANWERLSLLAEMFYGHVECGSATDQTSNANPWGYNALVSFMLNNCWELIGRFSYVNSDCMGMTVHDTYGCVPNDGKKLTTQVPTLVASHVLFEKVYAGYIGFNYYMCNKAVKFMFGLEQARYKNRISFGNVKQDATFNHENNCNLEVKAALAALQIVF